MNTSGENLLEVEDLCIAVKGAGLDVIKHVSFSIRSGEIVGIVGESGSGKTLAARSVIRLLPEGIEATSGRIAFEGEDVLGMSPRKLRKLRGSRVGMVFQEPMTSLNPSMLLERQLDEALALHCRLPSATRQEMILDMLRRVGLEEPKRALTSYPHEFSGGMRQRIMLASVMLLKPSFLIADEPTTALDAVVQRDVLELMVGLTREQGTAVMLISHDLSMVARYCDRIIVMCRGEVVETGDCKTLLENPQHPYTRKLLGAMPKRGPERSFAQDEAPLVSVRDLVVDYPGRRKLLRREPPHRALHGISLDIAPGQVVAMVGSSGSGKTTLGQALAGLVKPSGGSIGFDGKPIDRAQTSYWDYRFNCQMIFQDPYSSLDPRDTIGRIVGEPLRHVRDMNKVSRAARVAEVLEEVQLGRDYADRFPHELSGGQRQRVAIARAIVRRPRFVIADEAVSALDVTVRAQILDLFADLQNRHGFSCLFISHDLGVVEQVADRVVVMDKGKIVEEGDRSAVFDNPQHPFTRKLLSVVPALEAAPGGGVRLQWRLDIPGHGSEITQSSALATTETI
ncbi:ABC transporter ATP-binding protein [Paracoccus onubensis]|uniref:ABC transporter ATP-binding protein n=1 Tax=Paracoccus onubensis TaxID=1675788 RepID=UPI00272F0C4C|nr:ABC transporter ATP-binding protein [Paracoccus onubensis]MDP0929680.1 ABC transporter ATP-binding protein [Paracoccus onubensis]